MRRFAIGDRVLVRRSFGQDQQRPLPAAVVYHVIEPGLIYEYGIIQDGFVHYTCDAWLVPHSIVINEEP